MKSSKREYPDEFQSEYGLQGDLDENATGKRKSDDEAHKPASRRYVKRTTGVNGLHRRRNKRHF